MKLEKKRYDDIVILKFTGELDSFNLQAVGERIDRMIAAGDSLFVFDLHLLIFMNSAALGYMIKTSKTLKQKDGEIVLARPSRFLKKALSNLGLEHVFKVYGTVEDGIRHFKKGAVVPEIQIDKAEADESLTGSVPILFRTATGPKDSTVPNQVGRIVTLYEDGLLFRCETSAKDDPADKQLKPGATLKVKFRQPFAVKEYYFEIDAGVVEVTRGTAEDKATTVKIKYDKIKEEDRRRLSEFVRDQEMWRAEVKS